MCAEDFGDGKLDSCPRIVMEIFRIVNQDLHKPEAVTLLSFRKAKRQHLGQSFRKAKRQHFVRVLEKQKGKQANSKQFPFCLTCSVA